MQQVLYFARALKLARVEADLMQRDLAVKTGLTRLRVVHLEQGVPPRPAEVTALCDALPLLRELMARLDVRRAGGDREQVMGQ